MDCLKWGSPYNIEVTENFCIRDFIVRIVRNKEKCYNDNIIIKIISNTWNNADRLCEILKCTKDELPDRVPMEKGFNKKFTFFC